MIEILSSWDPTLSKDQNEKKRRGYMTTGLVSKEMLTVHRFWFTPCYYFLNILLITLPYTLIRYNTSMPFILVVFFASIFILLAIEGYSLFQEAVNMRIAAQDCIDSHLNEYRGLELPRTFWRSCQPPVVKVGQQFTISSKNYSLDVFGNVIFRTLADLLVSF